MEPYAWQPVSITRNLCADRQTSRSLKQHASDAVMTALFSPYIGLMKTLIKAWNLDSKPIQITLVSASIGFGIAGVLASMNRSGMLPTGAFSYVEGTAVAAAIISGVLTLGVLAYMELLAGQAQEEKIQTVEQRVREHPEKPQLAWDLARVKLESYLDRNLSQVQSIYWLTLVVMLCGFGFVSYGLYQVSESAEKLPVSVVASASGVLISFIGGSFLVIYRSILAQSKGYVSVLERINAVGMAVQVIATIPESDLELKNKGKAALAEQLLKLYAEPSTSKKANKTKKKA
jgi:hypothetical protein